MSEDQLPQSYGDVAAEYHAVRRGAALVEPLHEVLWVRGSEAIPFLDGILSQDVAGMAPGQVARTLLLQPQGKLEALLWALRGRDRVGLVADAGTAGSVRRALERFRFRVDAGVGEVETIAAEVWGPLAAPVLEGVGLAAADGWESGDGLLVAALPMAGLPRYLVSGVTRSDLEGAGARPAGTLAVTSARIEAGEPVMGVDVDGTTLPHETGLVRSAVSFEKGCYLGQELVSRIESRGRVTRRLCGVQISGNVLPPAGAELLAGDAAVGRISSVGESLELRAPVALAMIRWEVESGETVVVRWEGGSARGVVRQLPLWPTSSERPDLPADVSEHAVDSSRTAEPEDRRNGKEIRA